MTKRHLGSLGYVGSEWKKFPGELENGFYYESGETLHQIARDYGLNNTTVWKIVKRKIWKNVP